MPVTNYVWDPLSDNVLLETDENDVTQAVYTQEPDTFGHLISQRRDDETSWYQFDGLGSTRELTNASETVTDTNMYDAWGVNVASTGSTGNPFHWVGESGYYEDSETGDYYVRARMYRPTVARWSSRDVYTFQVMQGPYAYAINRPASIIDPSGYVGCERSRPTVGPGWTPAVGFIGLVNAQFNVGLSVIVEGDRCYEPEWYADAQAQAKITVSISAGIALPCDPAALRLLGRPPGAPASTRFLFSNLAIQGATIDPNLILGGPGGICEGHEMTLFAMLRCNPADFLCDLNAFSLSFLLNIEARNAVGGVFVGTRPLTVSVDLPTPARPVDCCVPQDRCRPRLNASMAVPPPPPPPMPGPLA